MHIELALLELVLCSFSIETLIVALVLYSVLAAIVPIDFVGRATDFNVW